MGIRRFCSLADLSLGDRTTTRLLWVRSTRQSTPPVCREQDATTCSGMKTGFYGIEGGKPAPGSVVKCHIRPSCECCIRAVFLRKLIVEESRTQRVNNRFSIDRRRGPSPASSLSFGW